MSLEDDIKILSRQPLLGLMEHEALRLVAFAAESRILRAGDILFRTGEGSDGGYLVISGAIAMSSGEAGAVPVAIAGAGSLVGELALFSAVARPATAMAREPTQVMKLSRSVMRRVLTEFPGSAAAIAQAISVRLTQFQDEIDGVGSDLRAIGP